jgi:hypothetical protein
LGIRRARINRSGIAAARRGKDAPKTERGAQTYGFT